jgi:hypothetical protein
MAARDLIGAANCRYLLFHFILHGKLHLPRWGIMGQLRSAADGIFAIPEGDKE